MNVSPRGLRAFRRRPASRRQHRDRGVLAPIKEQSRLSRGSYGRPSRTAELTEVGVDLGHRQVGGLMRRTGIVGEGPRTFKATTDSAPGFHIAPNLLDLNFPADLPHRKRAGDSSCIWTREGWLHLAAILDLHSGRVIGWAVNNRMKRDLAIRALKMALALRSPPGGRLFHSDRGSQERSYDDQKVLREHGLKSWMRGRGSCHGNAAVETFVKAIKTIKAELIWCRTEETRRQAETALFQYINGVSNPRRRDSTAGGKSPLAFERQVA